MFYHGRNLALFEEEFLALEGLGNLGETPIQAEYRACLLKAKNVGATSPACKKPQRRAKVICQEVGGVWGGRKCSFPTPTVGEASPEIVAPPVAKPEPQPQVVAPALPRPGTTVHGPIPPQWAGTARTTGLGPKAKQCVKGGGAWIGPTGKRWCQMPPQISAPVVEVIAPPPPPPPAPPPAVLPPPTAALPKPGSTYFGPEPVAPPGGWPPYKGAKGPRQKKCLKEGGRWIGPTGKKWCQMTPGAPVVTPDLPVETPDPGLPADVYVPPPQVIPDVQPPPRIEPPSQACAAGFKRDGTKCIPVDPAPGPGYELRIYESGPYYQWVYTGAGLHVDPPVEELPPPSGPPAPDYTLPPGAPVLGPIEDGYMDPDVGEVWPDVGVAPAPLPPPLLEPIDETGYPVEMSAVMAAGLSECQPDFTQYLPMEYPDQYGMMKVLQVFCAKPSGAAGAGDQAPIESAEMYELGM